MRPPTLSSWEITRHSQRCSGCMCERCLCTDGEPREPGRKEGRKETRSAHFGISMTLTVPACSSENTCTNEFPTKLCSLPKAYCLCQGFCCLRMLGASATLWAAGSNYSIQRAQDTRIAHSHLRSCTEYGCQSHHLHRARHTFCDHSQDGWIDGWMHGWIVITRPAR